MRAPEIRFHLLLRQMDDRRHDMARRLVADLQDVLAEVGLHHLEPGLLQMGIERDLLGDHRLALGDDAGVGLPTDAGDDLARFSRCRRPMDVRAFRRGLRLVLFEIDVEVGERVIANVAAHLAQGLELGQSRASRGTLRDETGRKPGEGPLQLRVIQRLAHVGFEQRCGWLHGLGEDPAGAASG